MLRSKRVDRRDVTEWVNLGLGMARFRGREYRKQIGPKGNGREEPGQKHGGGNIDL
jgi:hypothetical protein